MVERLFRVINLLLILNYFIKKISNIIVSSVIKKFSKWELIIIEFLFIHWCTAAIVTSLKHTIELRNSTIKIDEPLEYNY